MKRPRFDLNKLMDMHGEGSGKLKKKHSKLWYIFSHFTFKICFFRQNCCDHRRCHRRGCGETRGIRAPSAGVCLDTVLMALNKASWQAPTRRDHDKSHQTCITHLKRSWVSMGSLCSEFIPALQAGVQKFGHRTWLTYIMWDEWLNNRPSQILITEGLKLNST